MCLILQLLTFSRNNSGPTLCISRFYVSHCFSPHSKSYSVFFSYSTFFSFLAIFQVLQCVFLSLEVFQCFSSYSRTYIFQVNFSTLFSFLRTFQVIECLCLIFHVFQFPPHNPGTTVCFFFHLSRFIPFFTIFQVLLLCFSFSMILHFHALLQVLQCAFLIYQVFPCFVPHNRSNNVCISFSMFFQFSHHDPGSRVCIFHFSRF